MFPPFLAEKISEQKALNVPLLLGFHTFPPSLGENSLGPFVNLPRVDASGEKDKTPEATPRVLGFRERIQRIT
jgi:hypothetical protein